MDYIYKDRENKKQVGEIDCIEIRPYYTFNIKTEKSIYRCQMHVIAGEWELFIHYYDKIIRKNQDRFIPLTYPTDIMWNTESVYDNIDDELESRRIAYAIKSIFEQYNYEDVSI